MGSASSARNSPTILIVDDSSTNLRFLQEILKKDYKVYAAPSGERALTFLESRIPDLILLDVEMPGMSGYEMITRLKNDYRWTEIPVIFLTAQEGRDKEHLAFRMGAVDYILKPISASVVRSRVRLQIELQSYKTNLEQMVEEKTRKLIKMQDSILDMLCNMTSYRDSETGAHNKRTTYYLELLVRRLMEHRHPKYVISEEYAQNMVKSAKLHDIGKIGVPDTILLKPGKLTDDEFEIIKMHTVIGAEILDETIEGLREPSTFLDVGREIVYSHHEWWDGTGYPQSLSGDEIPISARLMAIADVYDALISERVYKEAIPHDDSVRIIWEAAGTHFDPLILELCHDVFDHFPSIVAKYRDEEPRGPARLAGA